MQINIRDFILDELDDNEISELLHAVVLRIRHNTLTKTFSNKAIKLAFSIVLSDMNDTQAAIEKKNKRAEINRQNALKRWSKSAGITAYTNGNTIGNANGDAIAYAKEMQNLCKSDAKIMQNNFTEHIDNKEKNIIPSNTDKMQNLCESNINDNANNMQTEYENPTNNKQNNTTPKSFNSLLDTFLQQRNELQAQKEKDETDAQNEQKADTNIEGMKSIGSVLKRINLPKIPAVENKTDSNKEDMQEEMQNVCKSNANENMYKPFDMKEEIELFNKLNSNANCNANDYANEYANEHANEHTNNIEDKVIPCSSENKENTIPVSDLKPVSYALEKDKVLSVDNLLSDETDLSVQKIKEKEKRSKKEKEDIYNNIYNNKYINNNIFKEEKENLIKEKEESILSSNQDTNQAELESDSVSMQKENKKIIQIQPSGQPDTSDAKPKRFKAPSVDEVRAYIAEKGYSIDAEAFVDYYTSKGWVVGKSPMKDWRAAVRTWNKNNAKFNSSAGSSSYVNSKPNRMLTPNEKEAEEYANKLCQRLREKGILTEDNKPVDYSERKYKHG